MLDALDVGSFHHILRAVPIGPLDAAARRPRTLVTLLHLRDIASTRRPRFSITSEMADLRNRALAEVTRADDFIVTARLISLLMTQVAENEQLNAVFADLFDAAGSEIYLRPARDYLVPGVEVSYATVVAAARRRNEVAIGVRTQAASDAAGGVSINPPKSTRLTLGPRDAVIVLAE